jgi:hypothetical protein
MAQAPPRATRSNVRKTRRATGRFLTSASRCARTSPSVCERPDGNRYRTSPTAPAGDRRPTGDPRPTNPAGASSPCPAARRGSPFGGGVRPGQVRRGRVHLPSTTLTEAARQVIRVPPAPGPLAPRLEFVLSVGRRDGCGGHAANQACRCTSTEERRPGPRSRSDGPAPWCGWYTNPSGRPLSSDRPSVLHPPSSRF